MLTTVVDRFGRARALSRLGLAAVLCASVAACQETAKSAGDSMGQVMQSAVRLFEADPDPELDHIKLAMARIQGLEDEAFQEAVPPILSDPVCDASKTIPEGDYSRDIENLKTGSVGTWPIAAFETYLNESLALIAACAPYDPLPPAKVVIAPRNTNQIAVAMEQGLIVVDLPMLKEMKNHGTVMFLLAHEYSHVLLQHRRQLAESNSRKRMVSLVTEVAFLVDDVLASNKKEPRLVDKLKSPRIANKTADVLFFEGFERVQEHEADMLALHLLDRMGIDASFHYGALFSLIKKAPTAGDNLAALIEERKTVLGGAVARQALSEGKDGAKAELEDLGTDAVQAVVQAIMASHPTVEEREETLDEYIEEHDLGNDEPLPFVAAELEKLLKLRERAYASAEFAAAELVYKTGTELGEKVETLVATTQGDELAKELKKLEGDGRTSVSGPTPWFDANFIGRSAFASLRLAQDNLNFAQIGLKRAVAAEKAPLRAFKELMIAQILAKDFKGADETMELAIDRFGIESDFLYPMRIIIAQAQGEKATELLAACRLSGNPAIARECRYYQWNKDEQKDPERSMRQLLGT